MEQHTLKNRTIVFLLAFTMILTGLGISQGGGVSYAGTKGYLTEFSFRNGFTKAQATEYKMSPEFDPNTHEYTVYVDDSASYSKLYAFATLSANAPAESTISMSYAKSNGDEGNEDIPSGSPRGKYGSLSINTGAKGNIFTVSVGKGEDTEKYIFNVVRIITLKSLSVKDQLGEKDYSLLPDFKSSVKNYYVDLPMDVKKVKIDALATSDDSAIKINNSLNNIVDVKWSSDHSMEVSVNVENSETEGNLSTTYNVVLQEIPVSIEITSPPKKLEYNIGDYFDGEGMVVSAAYKNGSKKVLSPDEYKVDASMPLTNKDKFITVSHGGVIATQSINVAALFQGEGTENKPYIIKSISDLTELQRLVGLGITFEDYHFKMVEDITLSEDWMGIGQLKPGTFGTGSGKNILPFSGIFDGGNHTITIPEGGRALFSYVREATVKNLNIYGKKIADYGLVSNYVVDNGSDGDYYTGEGGSYVAGCPDTIDIINVTLKSGTQILKSGFIGGFASGGNVINIKDCIAEKDVIIGYDRDISIIGSFAGQFSGTIENCKSFADVYGKSYVGGLAGTKGQSMGPCNIVDSSFEGNIINIGDYSGGILGSGYTSSSAPNTMCVTIKNCSSSGTIKGKNMVGGILGGEPSSLQCWDNGIGYIQNNKFIGKVEATDTGAYLGSIIGYMNSLNKYNVVEGNQYTADCGATRGIGQVKYIDTSYCNAKGEDTGTRIFDTSKALPEDLRAVAKKTHNRLDDPLGTDKEALCRVISDDIYIKDMKIDGTYKKEYKIGESFSTKGMIITVKYSDNSTRVLNTDDYKDVTISGFENGRANTPLITLNYKGLTRFFTVNVVNSSDLPQDDMTVYFSLLGDNVHDSSADKEFHTLAAGNLITWIEKEAVVVPQGTNVWGVIEQALKKHGYSCVNPSYNYVESITNDKGITLAEFTNGKNSGWMYTLNGKHPLLGISEQPVKDGDTIIFHYTDDYTKEEGSEKWVIHEADKDSDIVYQDINAEIKGNEAYSSLSLSEVIKSVENAAKEKAKIIVLNFKAKKQIDKIDIEISKNALKEIINKTDASLNITTSNGVVLMEKRTIVNIIESSEGDTVKVVFEKKILTEEQKKILGEDAIITDITMISGDKEINSFNGSKICLLIPVSDKLRDKTLAVASINDKGILNKLTGKIVTKKEKQYFEAETLHLSSYLLGEESFVDAAINTQEKCKNNKLISGVKNTKITKISIKSKKGSVALKWKKSKGYKVDGYQVYKSTKKTKNFKKVWLTKKMTYKNTKGLTIGRKYYYKVRGYRVIDGRTYYSKWSNTASI